jgi:Tfp pilus assembly protein PilO
VNIVREYQRPLLFAGGALLIALLLWVVVISPESSKLSGLQAQETQLQSQQEALQAKLTALESEGHRLASNCADLQKIAAQIPSVQSPADISAQESSFESQFNALASASGVSLVQFSGFAPPGTAPTSGAGASPAAGVTAVPTTLTVTGNWGQITSFINGLDGFPRLFVIQQFVMSFGTSASTGTATPSGDAPALWIGKTTNPPGAGPYSLAITGSIFYTSAPNALDACAKAEAAPK